MTLTLTLANVNNITVVSCSDLHEVVVVLLNKLQLLIQHLDELLCPVLRLDVRKADITKNLHSQSS